MTEQILNKEKGIKLLEHYHKLGYKHIRSCDYKECIKDLINFPFDDKSFKEYLFIETDCKKKTFNLFTKTQI
jgi:hypothetical protein